MSNIFPESPSSAAPPMSGKNRVLLGIVIGLAILILLALGALMAGFFLVGNKDRADAAPPPATDTVKPIKPGKPVSMTLAPGYKILSSDTQPGRLILHVRSDVQDEIDVIDLENGRIITQIHASAPQ